MLIQLRWRGVRGRHLAAMMRALWKLRLREAAAAVHIQRMWRAKVARELVKELRRRLAEKERQNRAALIMQRVYRGHAGRTRAEVRLKLYALETEAEPLKRRAEMDRARLGAAQAELAESDTALAQHKAEEALLDEELEQVKLTTTKYHDSKRITGAPQRFLTRYLAVRLAQQLAERRAQMKVEMDINDELFNRVKRIERDIRAIQRELAPLQKDISRQCAAARSARLRAQVRGEFQAAVLVQKTYRGTASGSHKVGSELLGGAPIGHHRRYLLLPHVDTRGAAHVSAPPPRDDPLWRCGELLARDCW